MINFTLGFVVGLILGVSIGVFLMCCFSINNVDLEASQKLNDIEQHIKSYNNLDDKTKVILDTILLIKDGKVKVVKDEK